MADFFKNQTRPITGGAIGSVLITPSDTVDLTSPIRAITVGVTGTLCWMDRDGNTHNTATLPAGTYSLFATRIKAGNTSATQLTGWV